MQICVYQTRKTAAGTFRPGIVYTVNEKDRKVAAVLSLLLKGENPVSGQKIEDPVGKKMTKKEVEEFNGAQVSLIPYDEAEADESSDDEGPSASADKGK